jgi:ABC-type bacteriocin/lantibiotic exporter with double-glycine peptidase domain
VDDVISQAGLRKFINELPHGIQTKIQERGFNLSGGQKQRIGIARALYTNPKLLVLDEATSALDGTTEREIVNTLLKIKGNVTLLIIAHRLSTLTAADRIVYLNKGKVIAQGSIKAVRTQVPDFDKQFEMFKF